MTFDRQSKTLIAVFTLVTSALLVINLIVNEQPIEDWWLAGILFFVSLVFWVWLLSEGEEQPSALAISEDVDTLPKAQEWIISKEMIAEIQSEAEAEAQRAREEKPVTETPVEKDERAEVIEEVVEQGDEAPVVQEAKNGDQIAEAKIAEATAAKPRGEPEKTEAVTQSEAEAAPVEEVKTEAEEDEPDDLTRIEGIGPKYRDALIAAGINTFAELAQASMADIEAAAEAAGMRRAASMETWVEQARLAAANDWEGLDKLQQNLSGGRRE
ncbi:MAG: DUF4332 domain-containing protein [Chloroflexota bacterium]